MGDVVGLAVSNHDFSFAVDYGSDQPGDVLAAILVIPVGVDDNVRSQPQTGIDAGLKGPGKTFVDPIAHDMVHPGPAGGFKGRVGAAVVNHQDVHLFNALDDPGDVRHGFRQGRCFVVAGNLDKQFHLVFIGSSADVRAAAGWIGFLSAAVSFHGVSL